MVSIQLQAEGYISQILVIQQATQREPFCFQISFITECTFFIVRPQQHITLERAQVSNQSAMCYQSADRTRDVAIEMDAT